MSLLEDRENRGVCGTLPKQARYPRLAGPPVRTAIAAVTSAYCAAFRLGKRSTAVHLLDHSVSHRCASRLHLNSEMHLRHGSGLARAVFASVSLERFRLKHEDFKYASATDPFHTCDVVLRLARSLGGIHCIGSPLGPKPMTLGMILAALEHDITLVVSQARTYNPKYSVGSGRTYAYPLVQGGCRTYA